LSPQNTEKPQVAASRLPSFQSQTRTGTVCRSLFAISRKGQRRIPPPVRIAPPRVGNARTADASIAASVPCLPQEESDSGNLSGRLNSSGPENLSSSFKLIGEFSYPALMRMLFKHTTGGVLANLSKIPRKTWGVNEIRPTQPKRLVSAARIGAKTTAPYNPRSSPRRSRSRSAESPPSS